MDVAPSVKFLPVLFHLGQGRIRAAGVKQDWCALSFLNKNVQRLVHDQREKMRAKETFLDFVVVGDRTEQFAAFCKLLDVLRPAHVCITKQRKPQRNSSIFCRQQSSYLKHSCNLCIAGP